MTRRGRWLAEHWIGDRLADRAALALWEWASATGLLRAVFFPRPSTIAVHLRDLAADGTLWGHLGDDLARIGWSFSLAAVLGVAIGLAMGLWRRLREGPRSRLRGDLSDPERPVPAARELPGPARRDRAGRDDGGDVVLPDRVHHDARRAADRPRAWSRRRSTMAPGAGGSSPRCSCRGRYRSSSPGSASDSDSR